jgi:hypothetical protein
MLAAYRMPPKETSLLIPSLGPACCNRYRPREGRLAIGRGFPTHPTKVPGSASDIL